ncbi:hypothetical protein [Pseudomonas costantinii]|uniref:hypothetical protein n=1 Tax=Pseudomonas costantinii TaxID=168469 RepID=UPI0015A24321|nr:hypothetical protein [Pseudomonas costantinii]NVZ70966.1 hypothetical protein [Pseudomonas costantinii]
MHRIVIFTACVLSLAGCKNLQAPKFIAADATCSTRPLSLCLLNELNAQYQEYNTGAQNARVVTDTTALGAVGGAVIGAATNAHSDLYKATAGIALTAMGFSKYGNFKTQSLATRVASSKLSCAKTPLEDLLRKAGLMDGNALNFSASSGLSLAMENRAGVVFVQDVGTTVDKADYLTIGSLVTTFDNALSNIEKAKKVLREIDAEATSNIVGLQLNVINQIENDAFKLDEAMNVIKVTPSANVTPNPGAKAAIAKAQSSILTENESAVVVLESYNRYSRCMSGDFAPTSF